MISRFLRNHPGLVALAVWLLVHPLVARAAAINGTFNVVESWTVTLTYTGWGDGNIHKTVTSRGTSSGVITVVNSIYQCLDKTGIPGGAPAEYGRRTLSESNGTYHLEGGRVMPVIGAGSTLFGLVYAGAFIVKVDLIDGEIPIFYRTESYSGSGSSLTSITGGGSMTGTSLTVTVSSTVSFTQTPTPAKITLHPSNMTVVASSDAQFNALATGIPAPTYKWQRKPRASTAWADLADNAVYSGTRTTVLNIKGTTAAMNGDQFRCVATNGSSATSNPATLTVEAAPAIWTESWQKSVVRRYPITDTTTDGIVGDAATWLVADGADVCGPGPHPNAPEIAVEGTNRVLRMNVDSATCSTDLGIESAGLLNIPILTNTVLSLVQTGRMVNPSWNGAFPTLFPPPGDHVHLVLMDQNGNRVVYLFQRAADYPAHTERFPVETPTGHIASAGYHEILLGPADGPGGRFTRNLYADFAATPGFNPAGARIIHIDIGISGLGRTTFDALQIGPGIPLPPTVTTHPTDVVVDSGQPVTFTVTANGSGSLQYIWQRLTSGSADWLALSDSANFAGSKDQKLRITAVNQSMSGDRFRCLVSNPVGTATSLDATLTVHPQPFLPIVLEHPQGVTINDGDSAAFQVKASGYPAPVFSWQRAVFGSTNWTPLTNGPVLQNVNASNLVIVAATLEMDGDQYRCVVSNRVGKIISNPAQLTVEDPNPAPVTLAFTQVQPGGGLRLLVGGPIGWGIILESSEDFIAWRLQQVVKFDAQSPSVVVDIDPSQATRRFFRVRRGNRLFFDNGSSSGPQPRFANHEAQRLYDDFRAERAYVLSDLTWQQHDATNMTYRSTTVRLFSGPPELSQPLFMTNVVASRIRNQTVPIFGGIFNGYDYAITGLSIPLTAGTYYIGFSTVFDSEGITPGSGWDNTLGGPQTIPGARLINSNSPPPGKEMSDFSFRIYGLSSPASFP